MRSGGNISFPVATIAIAYDNAPYARKPVEWQLPKLWVNSTVMGLLLAAGTWILRGTLFLSVGLKTIGDINVLSSVTSCVLSTLGRRHCREFRKLAGDSVPRGKAVRCGEELRR